MVIVPSATATSTTIVKVRKTITFTGASGLGQVSVAVPLFTLSGRIRIAHLSVFCTLTLVGATATIALGTASLTGGLITATTATNIVTNRWWNDLLNDTGIQQESANSIDVLLSESIIATIGTAGVTGGTLVIDVSY